MFFGKFFGHNEHSTHDHYVHHENKSCGGYKSGLHLQKHYTGSAHSTHAMNTVSYGGDHVGFNVTLDSSHHHAAGYTDSEITGAHAAVHICF